MNNNAHRLSRPRASALLGTSALLAATATLLGSWPGSLRAQDPAATAARKRVPPRMSVLMGATPGWPGSFSHAYGGTLLGSVDADILPARRVRADSSPRVSAAPVEADPAARPADADVDDDAGFAPTVAAPAAPAPHLAADPAAAGFAAGWSAVPTAAASFDGSASVGAPVTVSSAALRLNPWTMAGPGGTNGFAASMAGTAFATVPARVEAARTALTMDPAAERAPSFAAPASGPQPQIISFGTYTNLADTTTTATGQTTAFSTFNGLPVINGNNVALLGSYNRGNGQGIFTGTAGTRGATTVADYATTATNQTTVFSGFGTPVISGTNVAFAATYNASNGQGVFTGTAGTRGAATVADYATTATNQTTVFSGFSGAPVISGNNVAFLGFYNGGTGRGIFTGTAGTRGAATLADYATTATNQTTVFSGFGTPVISGTNVAYFAYYNANNGQGIFTGTVGARGAATIADFTTTATNQTTTFSSFNSTLAISGSNVAFRANYNANNGVGIFTGTAGIRGAATLADYTTTATNQTTTFSNFSTPVISGSNVAFLSFYNGGSGVGIFAGTVGTKAATTIADYTTTAPGRGLFTSFSSTLAISGSNIAFTGNSYVTGSSGTTGNGLFLYQNGSLYDVAAVGEPLFGSTISTLTFSSSGLDGNTLTFAYTLANGVNGIDTTTVPEPSTWAGGALLLGASVLTLRRRRARRGCC